ncbi:Uncharacterised protein [Mycobacteroides abscessus subsp. massiliense]|nr:Uncharacterised protein [Mycobacteroides abscessus subsp. massiliense]
MLSYSSVVPRILPTSAREPRIDSILSGVTTSGGGAGALVVVGTDGGAEVPAVIGISAVVVDGAATGLIPSLG